MKTNITKEEKSLNSLYKKLFENAYNADSHSYNFKKVNKILRKHFKEMTPPKQKYEYKT